MPRRTAAPAVVVQKTEVIPPEDTAAAEAEIPENAGSNSADSTLPPDPATLKGPSKERVAIWARQSKANTIALCTFKEGKRSCYYPLVPVRDPEHNNDPKIVEEGGKKGLLHVCSWNPEHGEQIVFPPKKEDEI